MKDSTYHQDVNNITNITLMVSDEKLREALNVANGMARDIAHALDCLSEVDYLKARDMLTGAMYDYKKSMVRALLGTLDLPPGFLAEWSRLHGIEVNEDR